MNQRFAMLERNRLPLTTNALCGIIEIAPCDSGELHVDSLECLTQGFAEREWRGPVSEAATLTTARITRRRHAGDSPMFLVANLAHMQSELEAEFLRFRSHGS